MNPSVQRIIANIDAKSLRERIMVFAGVVLTLIVLLDMLLWAPQLDQEKQFTQQIQDNQTKIALMQTDIRLKGGSVNGISDTANRLRLEDLQKQSKDLHADLLNLSNALVKPENMSTLLEDILKRNGGLRLISLKTLPVNSLSNQTSSAAEILADRTNVARPVPAVTTSINPVQDAIYMHGVEIVIQGKYLDMLAYMKALEAMPWRLYWGKATMHTDAYPNASLTLTLFTLSLDEKWLNL